MCIDLVVVCFGNANGQISSTFDRVICPGYVSGGVLSFHIYISTQNIILVFVHENICYGYSLEVPQ